MTGLAPARQEPLSHSVMVDEIGLASAVLGDVLLRTSYIPLFARGGNALRPVAVEGVTMAWRDGRVVDMPGQPGHPTEMSRRAAVLGRMLAVRNMANIGSEAPLGLLMRWDAAGEAGDEADLLLAEAGEALLDPRLMIVLARAGAGRARGLRAWRKSGASIAVSDIADIETAHAQGLVDLVRMEAPWLSQQLAGAGSERLLRVAVDRLRDAGIGLLVDAVASPGDLQAALSVSADLMQGPHLAAPFRVGTVFDDAPRPVESAAKVVRLFG
jgi:hypothetical protein